MYEELSLYEVVIIGAGPAGISLATEACEKGISPSNILVLEKAKEHSWAIRKFYPEEKMVTANYKGNDVSCTGHLCLMDSTKKETLSYLDKAIADYKLNVVYEKSVDEIKKLANGQYVVCSGEECFVTKTVAIAIGVMGRPNRPSYKIPNEITSKIHFDVTSSLVKNEKVLVVGGGDSASEYAQYLVQNKNDVTFSYRRESISRMNDINHKTLLELGKEGLCDVRLGTDIDSVEESDGRIQVNFKDGKQEKFDHIFYALGGSTPKNFLETVGIKMSKEGPEVNDFFESKQEGIFLLGDLSAGRGGGSINLAFNNSHKAMQEICDMYLDCPK